MIVQPEVGQGILVGKHGSESLVIRGARVLDPVEGVDTLLDVRVDSGVIAAH